METAQKGKHDVEIQAKLASVKCPVEQAREEV
jgi:hypothetical protein